MKSLSKPDDAILSRKINKKILIGFLTPLIVVFIFCYVGGWVARKVTETKEDRVIKEFRVYLQNKK